MAWVAITAPNPFVHLGCIFMNSASRTDLKCVALSAEKRI